MPEPLLQWDAAPAGATVNRESDQDAIPTDLRELVQDAQELVPNRVQVLHPPAYFPVSPIYLYLEASHRRLELDVLGADGNQRIWIPTR
jgi:hypothetical protein